MPMELEARQLIQRAFGDTLRTLRKRAGIAQEKLALQAGIERSYMGTLERGKRNPTLAMIYMILPSLNATFPQFAIELDRTLGMLRRKRKDAPRVNR